MLPSHFLVLVALLAGACMARAADDKDPESDFDNEVLPQGDVVSGRVDKVGAGAPAASAARAEPTTTSAASAARAEPTTTSAASATPSPGSPAAATTPGAESEDATATGAPARAPGGLSRFLSDIIQIPIAVLRSVGSLLSNTFSRRPASSASTASDDASAHA